MKEEYFVYYVDGYPEDGDFGMASFPKESEALQFIEGRLKHGENRRLDQYTLVKGYLMQLKPVEVITKIEAK